MDEMWMAVVDLRNMQASRKQCFRFCPAFWKHTCVLIGMNLHNIGFASNAKTISKIFPCICGCFGPFLKFPFHIPIHSLASKNSKIPHNLRIITVLRSMHYGCTFWHQENKVFGFFPFFFWKHHEVNQFAQHWIETQHQTNVLGCTHCIFGDLVNFGSLHLCTPIHFCFQRWAKMQMFALSNQINLPCILDVAAIIPQFLWCWILMNHWFVAAEICFQDIPF